MAVSFDGALIVVDVQNDFCTGGALAVPRGEEVADPINSLLGKFRGDSFYSGLAPAESCFVRVKPFRPVSVRLN